MNSIQSKIIALSCSPSRGRNSDSMLDAFIEGLQTHEQITVEKVYLEDIYIGRYGFENRAGACEEEPDFKNLTESIKYAQGLVIATPTYNFSVPAHLKNFIDRLRFFALNTEEKNRFGQPIGLLPYLKTYFIVSGGTPHWAQRILFFTFPTFWLRSVFLYYGSVVYGAFYSGDTKTFKNKRILAQCRKEGIRYGKKVIKNSQNSILEKLFWRPPQHD
jgi:FMN-dependent NADH-azoreductase